MISREHLSLYRNSWDCCLAVLHREGIAGFATGLGPTLWRNVVWNGLYYGTMERIQASRVLEGEGEGGALIAVKTALVGCGVGKWCAPSLISGCFVFILNNLTVTT
jgi:hypothetical protein